MDFHKPQILLFFCIVIKLIREQSNSPTPILPSVSDLPVSHIMKVRQTAAPSNMFHVHSISMKDGLVSVIKHLLAFILPQYFFSGGEKLQILKNLSQWLRSMHMAWGKLHFSHPVGCASKSLNDRILIHIKQSCLHNYVPGGSIKYVDCIMLYLVQLFSQRHPSNSLYPGQTREEEEATTCWAGWSHATDFP